MEYIAQLLAESPKLSKAEFLANIQKQGIRCKVIAENLPLIVVSCNGEPSFSDLALTHEVSEHFGKTQEDVDLSRLRKPVAVRARKIPPRLDRPSTEFEKSCGWMFHNAGIKINFKRPKDTVRIYLTKKETRYGRLVFSADRTQFEKRKDKFRPFQSPVSLHPRIARALVNLARINKGNSVLDPFAGTGGILIEAGLMGAKVHGVDIKRWMVEGCKKNLKHYKIRHHVELGDSLKLETPKEKFDAVITDPPYGRSTNPKGLNKLYSNFMKVVSKLIKRGGYLVISSHKPRIPIAKGLKLVEKHELYIHKELTKKIFVYKRL